MSSPQTPGFGTDVLEDTRADERTQTTDNGDHERLSHYVPKDKLMDAMVNGTPGRRAVWQGLGPEPGPAEVPGVPRVQGDLGRHARRGQGVRTLQPHAVSLVALAVAAASWPWVPLPRLPQQAGSRST